LAVKPLSSDTHYRTKAGYLSRFLLFSTPVAVACVLSQLAFAYFPDEPNDAVNLSCDIDSDDLAAMQAARDEDFFDTSWLPNRSDFQMVSDSQSGQTMWNPLAKSWLTPEQIDLLGLAYAIGYQDGGKAHARLVQAVLMQETIAGLLGRLGHLTAPMVAARDVLRRHPELGTFHTDDQLIARLITDDEFNIRIASAYLKFLRRYKHSDQRALVAYNIGMNAARRVMDAADFKYVRKVERYLAVLVPRYNNKFSTADALHLASM
jgi:hypothetical protein